MFNTQKQLWLRLQNRKTYIRILIYFVCISISAMTVSTIVLYTFFSNALVKGIGEHTETELAQRAASSASLMDWTNDYAQRWAQSPDVIQSALQNYYDQYEGFQIENKLKDLTANNPFIDSVYVVNDYNGKIIDTRAGTFDFAEFYDQDILTIIRNWDVPVQQKLVPRSLQALSNGQEIDVPLLTLIIRYEMNRSLSSFVVNIDSNKLQTFWGQQFPSFEGKFYMVDEQGLVLSSSESSAFLKPFPSAEQMERMTSAHGWFKDQSESDKQVVVYTQFSWSGYKGWKMIEIIDEKHILGNVNQLRDLTLILYLLIFALTFYSVYRFSNKIYSPLEELVSDVRKTSLGSLDDPQNESTDEFSLLSRVFNRQKLQINRLADYWRNNRARTQEQILRELLLQETSYQRNEVQQLFEHNEISLPTDSLAVVIFRIDHFIAYTEKYPLAKDQKLIRYAITNIVKEVLSEHFPTETVDIGQDHMVAIVAVEEDIIPDLLPYLQICQKQITHYLQLSVTIAFSGFSEEFSDLHESYLTAHELTHERFKKGPGLLLQKLSKIETMNESVYSYPEFLENKIFQELKSGHEAETLLCLSEFLEHVKHFPYSECRLAIIQLSINLAKFIRKLKIEPEHSNIGNFTLAHEKIDLLENLQGVQQWLSWICRESIQLLIANQKNTKNTQFIPDVKDLVERHLQNPNLCSKFIAENMGMSINYVRSLFKEETSQSLSEYITDKRLEKTRELLLHTSLTVDEISERFGFSSLHSFYYAFKKKFGVPPAQFRRNGGAGYKHEPM